METIMKRFLFVLCIPLLLASCATSKNRSDQPYSEFYQEGYKFTALSDREYNVAFYGSRGVDYEDLTKLAIQKIASKTIELGYDVFNIESYDGKIITHRRGYIKEGYTDITSEYKKPQIILIAKFYNYGEDIKGENIRDARAILNAKK